MARSPRKGARSASRGRTASAKSPKKTPKSTKKTPATKKTAVTSHKMEFEEGDNIMARWPGTSLYFKSKVTFVRDDDNEYDVQFEDGTVYTLKAKDVSKFDAKSVSSSRKKTPSRSRSRGRSPGRKPKSSPARTPKTKEVASPKSRSRSSRKPAVPVKAPKPDPTPVRTSARLARSKVELSSDEEDGRKAIPNPPHPKRGKKGFFDGINLDWMLALFLMALSPLILVSLHTMYKAGDYKKAELKMPVLDKNWKHYWNQTAFLSVLFYGCTIRLMSLLPIGTLARAVNGNELRLNGFYTLLAILAVAPAMVMRKMDFSFVRKNYFHLMTSTLILSFVSSVIAFILSRWGRRSNLNPKGNTGNLIVDFFYGRELNPFHLKADIKLTAFRFSMIGMAVLNVALVIDSFNAKNGHVNPAVVLTAAFQVLYAMDALYFEEYYFFTYDAMNSGFGFGLACSYATFPFLPTLVTRYMIANDPKLTNIYLFGIFIFNALGYIVFRTSETQRCEFAKSPSNPSLRHLETMSTTAGRKLLCGGYWGLVRHPNILGDLMVQWSWILPAVFLAIKGGDLLVFYLPVLATIMLVARIFDLNKRNKRKYGHTWDNYCEKVNSNVVPYVF